MTKTLREAIAHLETNSDLTLSSLARTQPELLPTFRTAAVKSFEYVYELSIRLIRHALELKAMASPESDEMDFKTLVRMAAKEGLVDDPLGWELIREKRNITKRIYDQIKAFDVLTVAPQLVERSRFLLARLDDQDTS
jgi:nucleotidyltransferase substrate binding protein (TIGR01987 family)